MMDCTQYRKAILADPHELQANMRLHLDSCAECAAYTDRVRRFEDRLDRALRVELAVLPMRPRARRRVLPRAHGRGWLAVAASVVLGIAVAGSLWLILPSRSLAAAVVDHMAEEPGAWARTQVSVPGPVLEHALRESHVQLRSDPGLISYANSCECRGHRVPHLVMQTAAGPVTVMVLTHEASHFTTHFDEQGYRGTIVPVPGHGSLAVLERGAGGGTLSVDAVARRVLAAIDWNR